MNIGYLVPEFPGQTHIMFWREVQALKQLGERVALVSTRRPSTPCPHDFAADATADTHYVFPPSAPELSRWFASGARGLSQARAYLRELKPAGIRDRAMRYGLLASAVDLTYWARRHGIDHLHGHSCADAAHVLALANRLGGPPYSLTLHGDIGVYGTDHRSKMKAATFVQTVGRHLRSQVRDQAGLPDSRILETFMGVRTSAAREPSADRSTSRGRLNLVTVARLHPAKGHAHALKAIRGGVEKGLDLRYTIVGEGPHRAALVELCGDLGLRDRVTFAGAQSEEAVFDTLSKADAFALPSTGTGEAWPVSVMEAMSASLPVVATIIGATPEMITPGHDGFLVAQADEAALLDKFELLANDVDLRLRIGAAARATARQRFDVKVSAANLRDAIRAGLEDRRVA
jgi:colanic acid/amylovoran biosynthesis glycosyltransferase